MAQRETVSSIRGKLKAALLAAGQTLGLLQREPAEWFRQSAAGQDDEDIAEIKTLVAKRNAARAVGAFDEADKLRDQLKTLGVVVTDNGNRTEWRRTLP